MKFCGKKLQNYGKGFKRKQISEKELAGNVEKI